VDENIEPNLTAIFDQELAAPEAFVPEDLPTEWDVGQHRYFRVADEHPEFDDENRLTKESSLSKKLDEFREDGIVVLDYGRRWGSWIIKTMAPQ
jgi:hypothetical protein